MLYSKVRDGFIVITNIAFPSFTHKEYIVELLLFIES